MTHMIYHISYMEILIKLICCFDLSFLSFCLFEFFVNFVVNLFLELFSSCFDTSGSMIPLLVSEIPPCDAFCDVHQCSAAGIGYSSSWIRCQKVNLQHINNLVKSDVTLK